MSAAAFTVFVQFENDHQGGRIGADADTFMALLIVESARPWGERGGSEGPREV